MSTPIDPAPKTQQQQKQLEEKFSDELTPTAAPKHDELMPENPEDSEATKAHDDPDAVAKVIRESDPER